MATQVEIVQAGEAAVVAALKAKGWTITVWDTQAPGSTDIEATSGQKKLLVHAKAAIAPAIPESLSSGEERVIHSRATEIGAEAYKARVTLDQSLAPTAVEWRKLGRTAGAHHRKD